MAIPEGSSASTVSSLFSLPAFLSSESLSTKEQYSPCHGIHKVMIVIKQRYGLCCWLDIFSRCWYHTKNWISSVFAHTSRVWLQILYAECKLCCVFLIHEKPFKNVSHLLMMPITVSLVTLKLWARFSTSWVVELRVKVFQHLTPAK